MQNYYFIPQKKKPARLFLAAPDTDAGMASSYPKNISISRKNPAGAYKRPSKYNKTINYKSRRLFLSKAVQQIQLTFIH